MSEKSDMKTYKNVIIYPLYHSLYKVSMQLFSDCPVGLVVASTTTEREVPGSITGSGKSAIGFF